MYRPQKGRSVQCQGPICAIMQNFTPIGATVVEISVTRQRKNSNQYPLPGILAGNNGPPVGPESIVYNAGGGFACCALHRKVSCLYEIRSMCTHFRLLLLAEVECRCTRCLEKCAT